MVLGVLGGGVSQRRLDHEGRALINGISALLRDPRELPSFNVRTQSKDCMNQEVSPHKHGICQRLDFGLLSLPNREK